MCSVLGCDWTRIIRHRDGQFAAVDVPIGGDVAPDADDHRQHANTVQSGHAT
jgi:hypothetical protein